MCKCNPQVKTPFCGAVGCEWPTDEGIRKNTQYDYDKLFIAYEDARSDITVHFRKILELQKENELLKLEVKKWETNEIQKASCCVENELEKLKLRDAVNLMRECIEYYASGDQWSYVEENTAAYKAMDEEDLGTGDFMLNRNTDDDRVAGLKARQTLEKIKGVL